MNFPGGLAPDAQNDTNTSLLFKDVQLLYNYCIANGINISGGMQFQNGLAPDAENDTNTSLLFKIAQLLFFISGGVVPPPTDSTYLRPGGVFTFRRPGGIFLYLRP